MSSRAVSAPNVFGSTFFAAIRSLSTANPSQRPPDIEVFACSMKVRAALVSSHGVLPGVQTLSPNMRCIAAVSSADES
ncbi:MAG: hypothetical protein GQE15_33530 [Archangiaceae bacterium]|nr:hypothetical protein [Archangiaceae bacterium]